MCSSMRGGLPSLRYEVDRSQRISGNRRRGTESTRLPSPPGEFHPEPLTDPDLTLSRHPARAIARRLPPAIEVGFLPLPVAPAANGDDPLPSLHGHYPASPLLRSSPPLTGALVLSASRLPPLMPFPLGIAV
jgi:hypothetical protein